MATIDDVYALLTDPGFGLAALQAKIDLIAVAVGSGIAPSLADTVRAQLVPPSGLDNLLSEVSRLYSNLGGPGGTIYDWLDPSNTAGPAGQIADLHNLYEILVTGFPGHVDGGFIPDDSFYVLIYRAVQRTWPVTP